MNRSLVFILLLSTFASCIETTVSQGAYELSPVAGSNISADTGSNTPDETEPAEETVTTKKNLSKIERQQRESKLAQAEADYLNKPDEANSYIWYGRRLAYLGRYHEAIDIYTEGLNRFPKSYKLLRHRGHRYLTIRQFDLAIEDLKNAVFYSNNEPNFEIEQDGIPNAMNRPLSNTKFNIWYHLGLSYYMKGNYDKAISSFRKCQDYSNNNDLMVRTVNWLYASYRKLGNVEGAQSLVVDIPSDLSLIEAENKGYHDLILLYRGFKSPNRLLQTYQGGTGYLNAVIGYGVANYYLVEGRSESAIPLFDRILESDQWDSFGYIASEADKASLSATL
ncbi:MAG: tetratricopeptide repeat protein [Cyclobacteriaceae bacterium]